jgi:hypothetical protein
MTASHPRPLARRHFVWLLWIALLTPIAQTATTWHALSHARFDAAHEGDGKQALHETRCDLCLAGAALSSGAIPVGPPFLPHPTALHDVPPADSSTVRFTLHERLYESRAPPVAPH